MFFGTPLQRAIGRGMKPGGDLGDELSELGKYPIRSKKDASAICDALRKLPLDGVDSQSALHALTGLFQDVEGTDVPAFETMLEDGLPELIRLFDALVDDEDYSSELMFILKILTMYGSPEGVMKVIEAARRPFDPDGYLWEVILSQYAEGHPGRDMVFDALSDPLPEGFIAIALLDSANRAVREHGLEQHPFDSPAGWQRLQEWLENRDPTYFSYAHSATAALPFLPNPPRDRLLALAMDHISPGVQMESAWVAGKIGREAGLKVLARYCLDVNHSDVACRYLAELDREDLIPDEAREPAFQAEAELARWLAHPNELGRPPDALEIVDHRQLRWPPERESKPFWIFRYTLRDQTGLEADDIDCGLVGSVTWCFFTYEMAQRPPEDIYGIHCYWEMEQAQLIHEVEVEAKSDYADMLSQWRGAPLQQARVKRVAEMSAQLKYPAGLVALATATLNGEPGWVVLDGPRSAWYPQAEQPAEAHDSVLLMIHVGRQLLGLDAQVDRRAFLVTTKPERSPEQIIAGFERLLDEVPGARPSRQKELLGSFSTATQFFESYVDAVVAAKGTARSQAVVDAYERCRLLARNVDESVRENIHDIYSALGEHFDLYVDSLIDLGRKSEVAGLLEEFAPCWEHNSGYGQIGRVAFKAGLRDVAETFLVRLRHGVEQFCRCEEMSDLAEIWYDKGDLEGARKLLQDCLRDLKVMVEKSKYAGDRKMHAGEFQYQRKTYLRLFPDGARELEKLGIPAALAVDD